MKTCRKCQNELDRSMFSKCARSKDGLVNFCKDCFSLYFKKNPEKYKARYRKWRENNLERARELERKNFQNPTRKHKHRINQAFRRVRQQQATFKGHEEQIRKIYNKCPVGHHVDHIVPLRGKLVSGLHVPWNLQYLPALENQKKNNKVIL